MTILFLCREDNLVREIRGYARAFRRRGVHVNCVPPGFPLDGDLRPLLDRCPQSPSLIFHPDSDFMLLPWGLTRVEIPTLYLQADAYAFMHVRLRLSMLFDWVLLLHEGFEERFREVGHPGPIALPQAVDAECFQKPKSERGIEVASVGQVAGPIYQTRKQVLSQLSSRFRMNEWWRRHSFEELAAVYQESRVVINIARDDYPQDANLRAFEAMAAGALLITRVPSELQAIGFEEGTHFAGYRAPAEIGEVIRKFLADEPARRRIAEAGREKTLAGHTYDCRVKTLLERLEEEGSRLCAPARQWPEERVRLLYLEYFTGDPSLGTAYREFWRIARRSVRHAIAGAPLLARAWARKARNRMRAGIASGARGKLPAGLGAGAPSGR